MLSALRPEAAAAAGAVRAALRVLDAREGGDRVIAKGGLDMATGTDVRSQQVIRDFLQRAHPEHTFVGEEDGADVSPPTGSYWLVDPLCGTRNFAYRIPLYSVNVALIVDHEVIVAAVGDGAHGDVWVAARGQGAWLTADDELERIRASDSSSVVVLDRGRPGGPAAEKAARVLAAAARDVRWELRTLGSTLDLAYLAAGRIAGLWHFSRIAPLHFAAGTLIATEAGAIVTDDQGRPWTLDSDSLVAAATPGVHEDLLALTPAAVS